MKLVKFRNNETMPLFSSFWDNFFVPRTRDIFDFSNFSSMDTTSPAVNIKETKDDFQVDVAVPGMKKKDFKIELNDNLLMISSENENEKEEKDGDFTRKEFSYHSFQRSFTLPESIKAEKISAGYDDGVLSIVIPKKEEEEKSKKLIKIS